MAFGNTYSTTNPGSGTLNREDLSDVVSVLEPEDTPIYSTANKQTASNTIVEWGVDELKDPSSGATGIAEGADVTSFSDQHAGKAKLSNYVQKFRDDWMVSTEQQASNAAGGSNATAVASAKAKCVRNVKRFVEYAFCSDNDRALEDGAGTVNVTRGLGDWIDSGGPSDVPARYRTPAANLSTEGAAIDESELNEILRSRYAQVGDNGMLNLFVGSTLRKQISNYMRVSGSGTTEARYNVNEDATEKTIRLNVEFFVSDFGTVAIVNMNPKCVPAQDRGYLLPSGSYKCRSLVGMSSEDLPNQGGGQRGFCECIEALEVSNPLGLGKIS